MQKADRPNPAIWLVLTLMVIPAVGQENARSADRPCISKDEVVYAKEDEAAKKIKSPRIDVWPQAEIPEGWKGGALLELVVNSEGRVCDVHLLAASDKDAGVRAARHVADHWKFKPATLDGKAVAMRVQVMFGDGTGSMLFKVHEKPSK